MYFDVKMHKQKNLKASKKVRISIQDVYVSSLAMHNSDSLCCCIWPRDTARTQQPPHVCIGGALRVALRFTSGSLLARAFLRK